MHTRYPLSAPADYGRDLLDRFGLPTEAPQDLSAPVFDGLADVARTAHGPFALSGRRLNVGCTDDAWRQQSIDIQREYLRACEALPSVRRVVFHLAPRLWFSKGQIEQEGDYDRLVSAIQSQADFAAQRGLGIVLENNRIYYPHQMADAPAMSEGLSENQYFGARPEEWLMIVRDVARPNCFGCLDTSHACTAAHAYPEAERDAVMMQFLAQPQLIGHVHWNGNTLHDPAGRDDRHLAIDDADFDPALQRAIAGLDATLHLEHVFGPEVLEREAAFVAAL